MSKGINKISPTIVREQTLEWQRSSIVKLVELVERKIKGDRNVEKMKRSIKNLFQGVLIDMLNGGDPKIGTAMIIRVIAAKIGAKPIEVQKCISFPNDYRPPSFEKKLIIIDNHLSVEYDEGKFTELILPSDKLRQIVSLELNETEMIHFVERYAFLMPELGFFWSIHPDAYEIIDTLKDDNTHKIIEGFASPLNHNLSNWCSVYQRDNKFGAIGNYQDAIQNEISPTDKSIRWVINPAYTEYLIDIAHRGIVNRMEEYPNDEFLLLLPAWPHLPIVEWLVKNGECWYFEGGTYKVYDYLAGEDVNVPNGVNMLIGYVRSRESSVPTVPFVSDVVMATTLAGASPKPKIITIDDIRTNNINSIKL